MERHGAHRFKFASLLVGKVEGQAPGPIPGIETSVSLSGGMNTADVSCGKPRFVVTPEALAEFERRHSAAGAPKPAKRHRRGSGEIDFFPEF